MLAAGEHSAAAGIEQRWSVLEGEKPMDRRLFLTGLLGVVGTTAVASVFPRPAEALVAVPPEGFLPESVLPDLEDPAEELDENIELVSRRRRRNRRRGRHRRHHFHHRRRYHHYGYRRRRCRGYWHHGYWRRRCRRRRPGFSIFISI